MNFQWSKLLLICLLGFHFTALSLIALYIETFIRLHTDISLIHQNQHKILHHDNTHSHTRHETENAVDLLSFQNVLPHPAYSPNLAPPDFFSFPHLKWHLQLIHFKNDVVIQETIRSWFRSKIPDFYVDGIDNYTIET